MNASTPELTGHVIVVDEQQVSNYSGQGYSLREIIYSDYVEMTQETTSDNDNGYQGSYNQKTHTVTKPHVLRKARFVMVQSADETIAQQAEEIERFKRLSDENYRDSRKAADAALAAEKRIKELTDECTRQRTMAERSLTSAEELRAAKAKLERDIGKLRSAVGDLKFKEILAPPPAATA